VQQQMRLTEQTKETRPPEHDSATPDLLALWEPEEELHRLIAAEDQHGPTESPLHRLPRRRKGRTT
jgi:hypothetical protein